MYFISLIKRSEVLTFLSTHSWMHFASLQLKHYYWSYRSERPKATEEEEETVVSTVEAATTSKRCSFLRSEDSLTVANFLCASSAAASWKRRSFLSGNARRGSPNTRGTTVDTLYGKPSFTGTQYNSKYIKGNINVFTGNKSFNFLLLSNKILKSFAKPRIPEFSNIRHASAGLLSSFLDSFMCEKAVCLFL